jgi:hypothetical protein
MRIINAALVMAPAAIPDVGEWQYGGKYYSLYDCDQSGQEGVDSGASEHRCDPVLEPDGNIAYWNLHLLYDS